uniref:U6 snRNA-associated Sm-like protein LSm4 n=1 Tax=Mandrillus leucophaeus TaxID=9568 RepID=A0A2K5XWR6_MANLE
LPLSLLKTAQNHPMLVELKNGETYNGHLVSCDNWMNINLREVICTSRDGDKFWRMPECYIRGSTIKYLRIPDEIIDMVKEEVVAKGRGRGGLQQQKQQKGRGMGGAGRGGSPIPSGHTWGGRTATRGIPPSRGWPSCTASEPPDPPGPLSWSLAMSQGPARGTRRPGTQSSSHCSSGHIKSPPQASVSPLRGSGGAHLSRPLARTPRGAWCGSQGHPPPPEMMNWRKIPFV